VRELVAYFRFPRAGPSFFFDKEEEQLVAEEISGCYYICNYAISESLDLNAENAVLPHLHSSGEQFFLSRWSSNSSSPVGRAILPLPLVEQFFLSRWSSNSSSPSCFRWAILPLPLVEQFFLSRWSSNSSSPSCFRWAILPHPHASGEQFFLTLMLQVSNPS